jgi:hypothetical protein
MAQRLRGRKRTCTESCVRVQPSSPVWRRLPGPFGNSRSELGFGRMPKETNSPRSEPGAALGLSFLERAALQPLTGPA